LPSTWASSYPTSIQRLPAAVGAEFEEFAMAPNHEQQQSKTHVLFAYIPNLNEYHPQQEK